MPKSASFILYCVSQSRDAWFQESKQEMDMVSLTTTPYDPLIKFLFPVPSTVCPIGPEVLVLEEVGVSAVRHNEHSIGLGVKATLCSACS